jgi:hypothetical protein
MVVKKGDAVVVSTAAANWDDTVFPQPDNLDFDRDARHQLAFGHGIHRCIAQNLARVELEIVFNTLFARVSGLGSLPPSRNCPSRMARSSTVSTHCPSPGESEKMPPPFGHLVKPVSVWSARRISRRCHSRAEAGEYADNSWTAAAKGTRA